MFNTVQASSQWHRFCSVLIVSQSGNTAYVDSVGEYGSSTYVGAHIKFETTAWLTTMPKHVHVTIYNPDKQTFTEAKSEGALIVVLAGYLGSARGSIVDLTLLLKSIFSESLVPKIGSAPPGASAYLTRAEMQMQVDEITNAYNDAYPDNNIGPIFYGEISQAYIGRENATDTFLKINAVDAAEFHRNGFVAVSVPAGTTDLGAMRTISASTRQDLVTNHLITYNVNEIDTNELPDKGIVSERGTVYFGQNTRVMRKLAANNGADYYVVNNTPTLLARSQFLNSKAIVCNRDTGMIGMPQQTISGIIVRMLMNPLIQQGMMLQLNSNDILLAEQDVSYQGVRTNELLSPIFQTAVGNYKILSVTHVCDSRGQDWYSHIVCFMPQHTPIDAAQYNQDYIKY